ncbi:hypothetical protein Hanom_Chr07g00592331 [Helianthus anomalus]
MRERRLFLLLPIGPSIGDEGAAPPLTAAAEVVDDGGTAAGVHSSGGGALFPSDEPYGKAFKLRYRYTTADLIIRRICSFGRRITVFGGASEAQFISF